MGKNVKHVQIERVHDGANNLIVFRLGSAFPAYCLTGDVSVGTRMYGNACGVKPGPQVRQGRPMTK